MRRAPRLPLLQQRQTELTTCVYCPKLCRAVCPVAEAEPRETLTPWGKMSLAWFASQGTLELEPSAARTAWACTGCMACREACDHDNPVEEVLTEARAELYAAGLAPAAARASVEEHAARMQEVERAVQRLERLPGVRPGAPVALMLGCGYLRRAEDVAEDIVVTATHLLGDVQLVRGCCGATLDAAGARGAAAEARAALRRTLAPGVRWVVVDPSCARALGEQPHELFLDLAYEQRARFRRLAPSTGRFRWHDPCSLGRGLGRYDQPRALLAQVLGRAPEEFPRCREHATCSGGGGLLPRTYPEISAAIGAWRLSAHEAEGGGVVVTHCASSLRRFRASQGSVVDLASLLRRALHE